MREIAETADIHAQALLGRVYLLGLGTEENINEAEKWLALAKMNLETLPGKWAQGICYEYGLTSNAIDIAKAVNFYNLAAQQGYAPAIYSLGKCYEYGYGLIKDEKMALSMYLMAANRGCLAALYSLGIQLEQGTHIKQDEKLAMKCYCLAANKGHTGAQYVIGMRYQIGFRVTQNIDTAIFWYQKAANKNHQKAKIALNELKSLPKRSPFNFFKLLGDLCSASPVENKEYPILLP